MRVKPGLQEYTAVVRKGLLPGDPALYIIIPLVSEGKSGQSAVWETIHSTNKQYKVHSTYADKLELTHSTFHHSHKSWWCLH